VSSSSAWHRMVAAAPYVAGAALHLLDVLRVVSARRDRALGPVTAGQVCGAGPPEESSSGFNGCRSVSLGLPHPKRM
jgi:hypothetical protein